MTYTKIFIQVLLFAAVLYGCSQNVKEMKRGADSEAPPAMSPEQRDGLIDNSEDNATPSGAAPYTYNWGVSGNSDDRERLESGNYSVAHVISSSAAVENKNDTTRKFIRHADLKFRVKDVAQATYALEDIAAKFDGFVTATRLFSTVRNTTVVPVSADSSLETMYYVVQNTMQIRVPVTKLDSTLKSIPPLIDHLDHRNIYADDVQFQLLENRLQQQRNAKYQGRMENAVDERGKKLTETTNAEDKMLSKQEQADAALVENLKLDDKIRYSTIELYIYQRESFRRELIPNDKNIEAYTPGFFAELADALLYGWRILESIVLFLVKSWGVLVFIAALLLCYRLVFFRRRNTEMD